VASFGGDSSHAAGIAGKFSNSLLAEFKICSSAGAKWRAKSMRVAFVSGNRSNSTYGLGLGLAWELSGALDTHLSPRRISTFTGSSSGREAATTGGNSGQFQSRPKSFNWRRISRKSQTWSPFNELNVNSFVPSGLND
jgi:hypothetical protein